MNILKIKQFTSVKFSIYERIIYNYKHIFFKYGLDLFIFISVDVTCFIITQARLTS